MEWSRVESSTQYQLIDYPFSIEHEYIVGCCEFVLGVGYCWVIAVATTLLRVRIMTTITIDNRQKRSLTLSMSPCITLIPQLSQFSWRRSTTSYKSYTSPKYIFRLMNLLLLLCLVEAKLTTSIALNATRQYCTVLTKSDEGDHIVCWRI